MSAPALTLLVLRTRVLAASRRFYEALGLVLVEERHGEGPTHFASQQGRLVIELYPARPGEEAHPGSVARLGFEVERLDEVLDRMEALGIRVRTRSPGTGPATQAVVEDPDGRAVELSTAESSHA